MALWTGKHIPWDNIQTTGSRSLLQCTAGLGLAITPTAVKPANAFGTHIDAAVEFRLLQMISLIDDDESVRDATASLLRSLGYQVKTFDSAPTFLASDAIIKQSECVITDILMPGVDGIELYRFLMDAGYRIPVIFLTALIDAATTARIRRCHVHGILIKPCSELNLIRCINAALEFHRSPAACGLVPS
jgi:CheY-like chemotaxis protein